MKIYLLMAGEATRWGGYLNTPKHFAPVHTFGPTVENTIQKFQRYAPQASIYGVVKDIHAHPYVTLPRLGISLLEAHLTPENGDADKLLSSSPYWTQHQNETTVLVWADSWLTDACVRAIVRAAEATHETGWHVVARWDANPFTGAPGGENFAHIVKPNGYATYLRELDRVVRLYKNGTISRNGGWELYRALCGLPDDEILKWWDDGESIHNPNVGHSTSIVDGSEDFDGPRDWDEWHWRFHQGSAETKLMMLYGEDHD